MTQTTKRNAKVAQIAAEWKEGYLPASNTLWDAIASLEAERDALLAVLKRIIDRATAPMSIGHIDYADVADARAAIAKAEADPTRPAGSPRP